MPVKYVINGYFRSGTTMLYDAVSDALGDQSFSFYEPCYPKLGLVIRNEEAVQKTDPLHGKKIWREYHRLDDSRRNDILRNHPNTSGAGIQNDPAFLNYIHQFHSIPEPVFLQTNRYHFFLDVVFKEFHIPVAHVIRNPIHVYESICAAYFSSVSPAKKIIRRITQRYTMKNFFGLENEFDWIVRHTGFPLVIYNNWRLRHFSPPDYFTKFVVVWIVSNYYALRSIEKNNGRLLIYEQLLSNPEKEFGQLSQYFGFSIKSPAMKPQKQPADIHMMSRFEKVVENYKLLPLWEYICTQTEKQGITYSHSNRS